MDEIIKTFHIDWKLLIAQLVNFGIVLFVLWRFALKPLSKNMEKRGKEIAKSLDDAKEIEEKLSQTRREVEEKLLAAKKEARSIIQKAQEQGKKQESAIIASSQKQSQELLAKAKTEIELQKEQMLKEIKNEAARLVVAATQKVLETKIDAETDQELAARALNNLTSKNWQET